MPSYEQPTTRDHSDDDAHYQPGETARKHETDEDVAENEPEAASVEETEANESDTDLQEERKAITWSDLAEEKSEDALAPILETGPRAPCLITPDGEEPESSVKRYQPTGESTGPQIRMRTKAPKKAETGPEEGQPGEVDPKTFTEKLSGANAQGYPGQPEPAARQLEDEDTSEPELEAMPKKEAFRPKDEATDDGDEPSEAVSETDGEDEAPRPKRKRPRRRRKPRTDGEGDAREGGQPRGERENRRPKKKTARQGNRDDRGPRNKPAAKKAEEPKGLLGKLKQAVGSIFGAAPTPEPEKPANRGPKKKTARKRARQGDSPKGEGKPRGEGGGGNRRRRRPRKRARRDGDQGGSNENRSQD